MELTEIIAELESYTDTFPRLALERAIAKQEAITPILLATVEEWKSKLEELSERPNYFLHIYAMYLLAQFREPQAYLPIVEFFSVHRAKLKFIDRGLTCSRRFLGGFCIMLQYLEKFSRSTLNRMIGRNILLLYRKYAEFFSLSTQIWVDRWKVSA